MHLKAKLRQSRRDFTGIYECAHCGHEERGDGYDDAHFHHNVIPAMACKECGQTGGGPSTNPTIPAHIEL